jgi:uncharacterized RDD family membrane protein YckC
MFCSRCGTSVSEGAAFCSTCGAPVAGTGIIAPAAAPAAAGPAVHYAGFWLRFVAFIIDAIVLGVVGAVITVPFVAGDFRGIWMGRPRMSPEEFFPLIGTFIRVALLRGVINWLYYALFESSTWQATLGKKALGLEVTDLEGRRIGFGRATGRFFGKIISGAILMIGFIMAGFTEKKQALHDIMAGCLVIRKI